MHTEKHCLVSGVLPVTYTKPCCRCIFYKDPKYFFQVESLA